MNITPVILSGGIGTRLWPYSRKNMPKQFLKLVNDESTFASAARMASDKDYFEKLVILANQEHRFLVAEELLQNNIDDHKIILEPAPRNTCAAIAAACMIADKNDIILVLPSDHIIKDQEGFLKNIWKCKKHAEANEFITFGIKPNKPATGYGYIKKANEFHDNTNLFKVDRFIEKPNLETAESFLENGNYLWNSGIFMFKAEVYLNLLKEFKPSIFENINKAVLNAYKDDDFIRLDKDEFEKCESISVDYAMIEHVKNMLVMEIDNGWADIGDWQALAENHNNDKLGNNIIGDIIANDTEGSYLHSEDGLLVAVGLKNVVAFKSKDVTLIADKSQSQNIRHIVERLSESGRRELIENNFEHKPWGSYENIGSGDGFKIKKLKVKPGCKISMQKHTQRDEHWVITAGIAKVFENDNEQILKAGEAFFVSRNSAHRIENIGDKALEIIEIQTGEYLGEDDIERLEDDYGRV